MTKQYESSSRTVINQLASRTGYVSSTECLGSLSLRMGLSYAKRLRRQAADELISARDAGGRFQSTDDLTFRVSTLSRTELALLARIGALNWLGELDHRREAQWQAERAGRPEGPLLRQQSGICAKNNPPSLSPACISKNGWWPITPEPD